MFIFQFEYVNLGQRDGLSEKDILKINSMYNAECNNSTVNVVEIHQQMQSQTPEVVPNTVTENYLSTIIKWFESIFGFNLWKKKNAFFFSA